ncbi:hypothetical protein [Streptomyces sp. cg35]|uniref:hypothetical protein n=1 Tax=Streptomyces sp. cg35 TaxID=3421650 RepID=UPI003D1821DA
MRAVRVAIVGAAAVVSAVGLGVAPAGAATAVKSCTTSDGGAVGVLAAPSFTGKTSMNTTFGVKDADKDGAWVRVRINITTGTGASYNYSWHENHDGYNSSKTWTPSASHTNGIVSARVQVDNVLGSSVQATCYSGKFYNPYY